MYNPLAWLWPNRILRKKESARLREEHNALVGRFNVLRDTVKLALLVRPGCGGNLTSFQQLEVVETMLQSAIKEVEKI